MAHVVMKYFKKEGRDRIALVFKYNESAIALCRALFARWSPAEMWWHLPYSLKTYNRICEVFRAEHTLDTAPFDRAFEKIQRSKRFGINDRKKVRNSLSPFALDEVKAFTEYLEGKCYSESSMITYTQLLTSFFGTVKFDESTIITSEMVDRYNTFGIVRAGYSVSYQRQFVGALKLYLSFREKHELLPDQLQRPVKEKRLPTVLSDQEVLKLMSCIRSIKHRCMVSVLYATGMRVGEVIDLEIRNVDFDRGTISIIQSKGAKDRMIGLSPALAVLIKNYMMVHNPQRYLFNGQGGGRYSVPSIRQIIKRAATKAGIDKRVTPHVLRHSYATHLIDAGVNLRHVQDLLGHAKPETTMIYTHVSIQKLINISSPFDQFLKKNGVLDSPINQKGFIGLSPT